VVGADAISTMSAFRPRTKKETGATERPILAGGYRPIAGVDFTHARFRQNTLGPMLFFDELSTAAAVF